MITAAYQGIDSLVTETGGKNAATGPYLAPWVRRMGSHFPGKSKFKFKQDDLGEDS